MYFIQDGTHKTGKENLNSDSQQFNPYQEKKNESMDMNIIIFGFPTLYNPQGNLDVRKQNLVFPLCGPTPPIVESAGCGGQSKYKFQ